MGLGVEKKSKKDEKTNKKSKKAEKTNKKRKNDSFLCKKTYKITHRIQMPPSMLK